MKNLKIISFFLIFLFISMVFSGVVSANNSIKVVNIYDFLNKSNILEFKEDKMLSLLTHGYLISVDKTSGYLRLKVVSNVSTPQFIRIYFTTDYIKLANYGLIVLDNGRTINVGIDYVNKLLYVKILMDGNNDSVIVKFNRATSYLMQLLTDYDLGLYNRGLFYYSYIIQTTGKEKQLVVKVPNQVKINNHTYKINHITFLARTTMGWYALLKKRVIRKEAIYYEIENKTDNYTLYKIIFSKAIADIKVIINMRTIEAVYYSIERFIIAVEHPLFISSKLEYVNYTDDENIINSLGKVNYTFGGD